MARNGQSRWGHFHCARRRGEEQPSCWTKMRLLMGRVNGEGVEDTGPGANQWVEGYGEGGMVGDGGCGGVRLSNGLLGCLLLGTRVW